MAIKLTETAINKATRDAAASSKRGELVDAGCPGLRLRVTPSGTRTWVLACRDREGRMRRFPLGAFPDKGISEARNQARALHTKVKQEGADPIAERRRELAIGKAAKEGIGTLHALLDLYGKHRGSELRSWTTSKLRVEAVFKLLLARPLAALRASEIQMIADDHPAKQGASVAVRNLRPVLKWGAAREYVAAEVSVLHPPAAARKGADPRRAERPAPGVSYMPPSLCCGAAADVADPRPAGSGRAGPLARYRHLRRHLDDPGDEEHAGGERHGGLDAPRSAPHRRHHVGRARRVSRHHRGGAR